MTPATTGSAAPAAKPADIIDIRVPLPSGTFTVREGDSYSVRELFGFPSADLMRVALRGDAGGKLTLRGEDVTGRTDFDPMDYNQLQYLAGSDGGTEELVAVARSGTKSPGGTWTNIRDSAPLQLTAQVTGTRSLAAAAALRTDVSGGTDADYLHLAQSAAVFSAVVSRKAPTLASVGDITVKAGDSLAVHDLFTAGANTALYRVAIRDEDAGSGARLLLGGKDVTHRVDFTPAEFINLQFVAGESGNATDLMVVARAGTQGADGTWRNTVDSPALSLTVAATGARSVNVAAALRTPAEAGDADAAFLKLAQDAAVFAPSGARSAPKVTASGDMTVKAGDMLSLRDLFPTGRSPEPALYRVALRDDPDGRSGGLLLLNGKEVTGRTDFSPEEFLSLQYVAGPEGGAQDILVVARAGKSNGSGGLTAVVDSPPAVIRSEVTGTRSLGAAQALRSELDPDDSDADFMKVATEAALYTPFGSQTAPGLVTAGNFTAAAGDHYALRDLFASPYDAKVNLTGYRVALRNEDTASGARLMLNGEDVTSRLDFTPAEFNSLLFVAGEDGSAQDLLVVARSQTATGMVVDSRAVQVTASVSGERSINAMPALRDLPGSDAYARIAQDAATYAPLGSQKAPALSTLGDFTAAAGDLFSMNILFDTAGGVFDTGMTYRVAMRDDPSGTGGGALLLNGQEVTGRTGFTGAEFAALVYRAGPSGSAQDLLVVARRTDASGRVVDSPATEITARSTGTRSLNALSALRTLGATGFDAVVQDAAVYRRSGAATLASPVGPAKPSLPGAALAAAIGAYKASGASKGTTALDLSPLFAGSGATKGMAELAILLGSGTIGGVRTTGGDIAKLSALAIKYAP
ncbi:hypothetical protein EAH89_24815 [Roseomonas nepalensis]|uniref:Uncharacterized protein n=1 Tax=Muricoccus nepalensis TaxID=1854500 RepID=A0A502FAK8_9PROT|nr:hypothetical protein EAH89_24815 [Roseomonas nepalensis]